VIEVQGLRKGFGDRLLIDNLNFNLPRGGIVGIIGPNGAGKTTLFRLLTGAEKPDAGEIASARLSSSPTSISRVRLTR
jgi:sulfate-transporting ATPase